MEPSVTSSQQLTAVTEARDAEAQSDNTESTSRYENGCFCYTVKKIWESSSCSEKYFMTFIGMLMGAGIGAALGFIIGDTECESKGVNTATENELSKCHLLAYYTVGGTVIGMCVGSVLFNFFKCCEDCGTPQNQSSNI